MFPGQQQALLQRVAELRVEARRTARRWAALGAVIGVAVGLSAGGLATMDAAARAATATRTGGPIQVAPGSIRGLALGRLGELLDAQDRFMRAVDEALVMDVELSVGVLRLCHAALEDHPRVGPALVDRLGVVGRRPDAPPVVQRMIEVVRGHR